MVTSDEIATRILDILETDLKWPIVRAEVTKETSLGSDGIGLDSVMIISAAVQIEETFGISIPDEDLIELADNTIGQAANYVHKSMLSNS